MKKKTTLILIYTLIQLISCAPLNPINDFFGIQMNPTDEEYFQIVSYSDTEGIAYKNSITMNNKINAWAEFEPNQIVIKIVNNSDKVIPLSYTTDQFILIAGDREFYLGKGERAEYFKKGNLSPNSTVIFNLDYPNDYSSLSTQYSGYSDQRKVAREIIRNYSKTDGRIVVPKEEVDYLIVKLGRVSIVLKKINTKG